MKKSERQNKLAEELRKNLKRRKSKTSKPTNELASKKSSSGGES